jgi:hypothetical protein
MLGPEYWLERARHARDVADWIGNREACLLLLEVAEHYEMIAKLAEPEADGFVASHWRRE